MLLFVVIIDCEFCSILFHANRGSGGKKGHQIKKISASDFDCMKWNKQNFPSLFWCEKFKELEWYRMKLLAETGLMCIAAVTRWRQMDVLTIQISRQILGKERNARHTKQNKKMQTAREIELHAGMAKSCKYRRRINCYKFMEIHEV